MPGMDTAAYRPFGEPLTGHTGRVTGAAFQPGSGLLATVAEDTTIRWWDPSRRVADGDPVTGHTDRIAGLAFRPGRPAPGPAGTAAARHRR
jgi:WD40 repeat protein